jgi:hypothetical protein
MQAGLTIEAPVMMVVAPPMAMTPAATMYFYEVGRFRILDAGALTGKRICSCGTANNSAAPKLAAARVLYILSPFLSFPRHYQHSARCKAPAV